MGMAFITVPTVPIDEEATYSDMDSNMRDGSE